ncbi:hypothetical protein RhiirA4_456196 [Rhizophagus irregularis]|uniref:Uncharacterized protein n=1 Tax=Rhizophagus irregularis TaxID=588596 RepID=A0A2I1G6Z1_9GLOM|nr:hypothetical protein RhiirA4_456196 [Rhizophagus irregularis]
MSAVAVVCGEDVEGWYGFIHNILISGNVISLWSIVDNIEHAFHRTQNNVEVWHRRWETLSSFNDNFKFADAAPTLKRDADAEAALAVKRDDDSLEPWELIPLGKRDADAEAALATRGGAF